jgi:SAM-dependent methyltransferase
VRRHNFRRVVSSYDIGVSPRVLDVGSGTGFYVALWEELFGADVAGLDITEVAVDRLREQFPQHAFHQVDFSAPLSGTIDAGLDAISGMDMFFHIVDDDRFEQSIRNAFSLLRPGGLFFYTDNFLQGRTQRSEHIIHRSLSSVRSTLRDAGFEIVDRQPVFVLMNEPVDDPGPLVRRTWAYIRRIAARGEAAGYLLGACLFPIELVLSRLLSESPTTEMMVCRKPEST